MPSGNDDQFGALSPTLIVLIGLVLLFAAVGVTRSSAVISRWFCDDVRRLLAVQIVALVFGLFGFVVVGRAAIIEGWSFDRVALVIGGFTIIAAGRALAAVMARKRRQIRRSQTGDDEAARPGGRPPAK